MSVDNFDNIIKNKFDNFSETPPDYIFDNVKSDFSKIKYSNPAKFVKLASLIGATAVISTIILLNIFNNSPVLDNKQQNKSDKNIITEQITNNNNTENINIVNNDNTKHNNNNQTEITETTINKTINGNRFNIKIKNSQIISSSNDLIISKDETYFYIKTNNYGVQKLSLKQNNKIVNYIIDFKEQINNNNNITTNNKVYNNTTNNKQTTNNVKSDFNATFIIKSPTCYNNNGNIYTIVNNDTYTFVWNDNSKEQNRRNIKSGKYSVTITNSQNTQKTYELTVNDSGIVKAAIMHEELSLQINYPIYFINKTTIDNQNIKDLFDYTIYWNFGDKTTSTELNPEHTYTTPGNYKVTLKVTSKEGCSDSATYTDIVIPKTIINIPNAFTPNGDGINDIFKLNVKSVKSFECIILDKTGKQIYKWTNPEDGWDGKINGNNMANDGIYYYVAKGYDSNNKPFEKTGFFYLFKNK